MDELSLGPISLYFYSLWKRTDVLFFNEKTQCFLLNFILNRRFQERPPTALSVPTERKNKCQTMCAEQGAAEKEKKPQTPTLQTALPNQVRGKDEVYQVLIIVLNHEQFIAVDNRQLNSSVIVQFTKPRKSEFLQSTTFSFCLLFFVLLGINMVMGMVQKEPKI